jgi:hypothetical protein
MPHGMKAFREFVQEDLRSNWRNDLIDFAVATWGPGYVVKYRVTRPSVGDRAYRVRGYGLDRRHLYDVVHGYGPA